MKLNLDRQAMEVKYGSRTVTYTNDNGESVPVAIKDVQLEDSKLLLYNLLEEVEFTNEILGMTEDISKIREGRIETLQDTVKTLQEHVKLVKEQREEWYACWERSNELVYKLLIVLPILAVLASIGIVNLITFAISLFAKG